MSIPSKRFTVFAFGILIIYISFFGNVQQAFATSAPTATNKSAAETYTEDTALNLIDIVVTDIDSTNVTVTLTLSSPSVGLLTTGTAGTVTSTFNAGTGSWTASGAIADVNTLLASVTFIPSFNVNSSFTIAVNVTDDTSNTITGTKAITGVAVNDAPTATNLSAAEAYVQNTTLNLVDIVASDVDSASVTATLTMSSSTIGTLSTGTSGAVTSTFNAGTGVWTASGAIASVNALLAGVTFTPASNVTSNFTISTSISDGILSVTGSKAMTGTAASNHAPVLDASRTPILSTILEDAGAPTGAIGTPVSSLVDFTTPAGGLDNVSDADASPLLGIAVTGVDSSFTCYYTLDGGGSWTPFGSVSDSSARLLAANSNNRIYCQPAPDLNGSFASVLTIRAWDRTSGTDGATADTSTNGGTTAFSLATDSVGLTVTAVNDAPTATNLNADEVFDKSVPLDLIDIVVSDIDSATVTATLTYSTTSVGVLSTGTSGVVTSTFNAGTGVWTASGPIADVNVLLSGLTFTSDASSSISSFTLGVNISDGIASTSGTKTFTSNPLIFSGAGSGAPNDPYIITSCTQLQEMKNNLTASYKLSGDIDCSDTVNWNGGKGFEPVGTSTAPFTGTFDGDSHTISNLTILRADDIYGQGVDDEQYVGIIGYASNAAISNLHVTNSKIKGWEYVGGMVGYAELSIISNVSFNQGLESDDCNPGYCVWARYGLYGGGIVGYSATSTISNAVVGASVKGSGNIIGGIVGETHSTNISYATSTARIDGGTGIGGIVGSANDSTISHVLSTGFIDVRFDDGKVGNNGGGIIGYASNSTTTDAVATGDVQGNGSLGGVVGYAEYSSFTFSTSTGSVSSISGGAAIGGFAGTTFTSVFATTSASGLVSGPYQVGGFVGSSQCQSLYVNDSAYGLVQITGQIGGGFAGSDWCQGIGSTFIRSSATGNVQGGGSATYLGGFIGVAIYTTISESSAAGDITGAIDDVGGFVGYAEANQSIDEYQGPISKSYSTGSVTATGDYIGGFAGFISSGVKISDSYSRGSVEGNNNVGGFVGANSAIARFERSYATGHATGTGENIAGFSGLFPYSETMFSNNYWDAETSGFSDDSNVSGFTVYATSTLAMKNQFTFINSGWDFASIWGQDDAVNDGYPYLYYQSTTSTAPILAAVHVIPSRVHRADAHYDFTVSEACNIQATLLSVSPASEAEVLVTDTTNPSGIKSATVNGMQVGSTYSFSFSCINRSGNVSNILSVGPFTVVADSEPLTVTPVYNAGPTFGGSTSEWISSFSKTSTPNIPFVKEKATSTATTTPKIFTRDLYIGSVGPDVKALQQYLNTKGFLIAKTGPGSVGKETTRFGFGTRTALIKFQKANKILPATGAFGPRTRGFVGSQLLIGMNGR